MSISKQDQLECLRSEYERLDASHEKHCEECDQIAGELARARFERDVCAAMMRETAEEIANLAAEIGG